MINQYVNEIKSGNFYSTNIIYSFIPFFKVISNVITIFLIFSLTYLNKITINSEYESGNL